MTTDKSVRIIWLPLFDGENAKKVYLRIPVFGSDPDAPLSLTTFILIYPAQAAE